MPKAQCRAVLTAAAVAVAVGLAGCGGGSGGSKGAASGPIGDAGIQAVDAVATASAGGFHQPIDAAPSPDGSVIYFSATDSQGPAIFSVPGAGGAMTTVAEGAPLAKPTGVAVATNGSRVYIADQQAVDPAVAGASGAILTAPTTGPPAPPTLLPGTEGWSPRGIDIVNQGDTDVIYFTGTEPASGEPGLFQVSTAGGTVSTIAKGAPFTSPDSVVVTTTGAAYVSDQGSGPSLGKVFHVVGSTVTPVLGNLRLGSPAGLTLIHNDATLLVSSIDPTTLSDQVLFDDLATGKTAAATKVIGANMNSSGGLHRAHNASVLAWADTQGTVYRVRFP